MQTNDEYNDYNQKSFMFLYLGQAVSLFGSSITSFIIIFYLTLLTESALVLAVTVLLVTIPQIFLTPVAGVFVDRLNRKYLLGIADFLQAFVTLGLIWIFIYAESNFELIILLLGLKGVFQAFHRPTFSAIVPSMVPKEKLMQNNSLMSLGNSAVELIAPIVAGLLVAFGIPVFQLLYIDIVTFLFAVGTLLFISIPSPKKLKTGEKKKSNFITEFREGIGYLNHGKGYLPLLFSIAFINFTFAPLGVLIPLIVLIYHGGSPVDFALVSVLLQGGIIFSSILLSTKIKVNRLIRSFLICVFAIYGSILIISFVPQGMLWILFISFLVIGLCVAVAQIAAQTILHKTVPLELQGRVSSISITIGTFIQPVGVLFAGLFAEEYGSVNLMFYFAVIGLTMLIVLTLFTSIRQVENQDTEDNIELAFPELDKPSSTLGD